MFYKIQHAITSDAEEIAKIQIESWQKILSQWAPTSFVNKFTFQTQCEKYRTRISNTEITLLVAKNESDVLGVIGANPNVGNPLNYEHYIFGLYVRTQCLRLGLGRSLLNTLLETLQRKNINGSVVFTFSENWPARYLYQTCGGELLSETDNPELDLKIPHVSYGFRPNKIKI